MLFLNQHLTQSHRLCHPCVWVSLVFGEQDDDMMEAAKTLMLLYLYQRRVNAASAWDPCGTGCNPHCHFIFLLQSVVFDHSVLLDFLISSETCFLEYFVGYLKLLRENWEDFCRVCQYVQGFDSGEPIKGSSVFEHPSTMIPKAGSEPPANQTGPRCRQSPDSGIAQSSVPRLVDYGSSDDSESEEQSASECPLSRARNERQGFDRAGGRSLSRADHAVKPAKDHQPTPPDVCARTVMCLTELRKVVARLQQRNLFPYRPASLLKLLMQIEAKSRPGCGSQC
ncbi:protein Lines homolog 1 [Megalops cyprinoides]|uniref:protein Lines homolog 1 n=1 Tax=Megalops cyprinoides TaxID=118141 RepID=UPI00186400B9|nr:protein Lines homolog 1 [Megalops cyprinoides]